jgi:hypothetical protein
LYSPEQGGRYIYIYHLGPEGRYRTQRSERKLPRDVAPVLPQGPAKYLQLMLITLYSKLKEDTDCVANLFLSGGKQNGDDFLLCCFITAVNRYSE